MVAKHSIWRFLLRSPLSSRLPAASSRKCSSFTVKRLVEDVKVRLEDAGVSEPRRSAERLVSAVFDETNLDHFLARHQDAVLNTSQAS
jgi:hypothetical protein